jgi:hypothetical protein
LTTFDDSGAGNRLNSVIRSITRRPTGPLPLRVTSQLPFRVVMAGLCAGQHAFERHDGDAKQATDFNDGDVASLGSGIAPAAAQVEVAATSFRNV